jgi:hypothetical protein
MDIGRELNLKDVDCDAIRATYRGDIGKSFTKMLTLWLIRANPLPTWTEVVAALRGYVVNERILAEQVERKYVSDVTDSGPAIETQEGDSWMTLYMYLTTCEYCIN